MIAQEESIAYMQQRAIAAKKNGDEAEFQRLQEKIGFAVVKVADDVRGHSTDSLIHKDHVGVVTDSLIHFVVTDSR